MASSIHHTDASLRRSNLARTAPIPALGQAGPALGSEKQLLLTIATSGGGITPVEAALESSLTVDEAEEILSRIADRGHLLVQSHEGTLYYTLPGRRSGALGEARATVLKAARPHYWVRAARTFILLDRPADTPLPLLARHERHQK